MFGDLFKKEKDPYVSTLTLTRAATILDFHYSYCGLKNSRYSIILIILVCNHNCTKVCKNICTNYYFLLYGKVKVRVK